MQPRRLILMGSPRASAVLPAVKSTTVKAEGKPQPAIRPMRFANKQLPSDRGSRHKKLLRKRHRAIQASIAPSRTSRVLITKARSICRRPGPFSTGGKDRETIPTSKTLADRRETVLHHIPRSEEHTSELQ